MHSHIVHCSIAYINTLYPALYTLNHSLFVSTIEAGVSEIGIAFFSDETGRGYANQAFRLFFRARTLSPLYLFLVRVSLSPMKTSGIVFSLLAASATVMGESSCT